MKPPHDNVDNKRDEYDHHSARLTFKKLAFIRWGRPMSTWRPDEDWNRRPNRSPQSDGVVYKHPFSDQRAAFATFILNLLAYLQWESLANRWRQRSQLRLHMTSKYVREGDTISQRIILAFHYFAFEISAPMLWLLQLCAVIVGWFLTLIGVRFPLLWLHYLIASRFGLDGQEPLPAGENGYTREFCDGEVGIDELEAELMTRNVDLSDIHSNQCVNTVSISYKHYANKGKVSGDDGQICRTDLHAIAALIKAAAPCRLRFWIDAKLPLTTDASFERWINRGVRPYGRYITFLCPSARKYAESSFWLANEYHFASAAKGAMYLEGNEIYYELRNGSLLDLYRRYLHVIIEAERHPVQVGEQDRAKVIHWALCCLGTELPREVGLWAPSIDNLKMAGRYEAQHVLMYRIAKVVTNFGPQELPVVPGRSWNKSNPLLLGDVPHLDLDLSIWYGLALDELPTMVYFVHDTSMVDQHNTVICLEVTLNMSHFKPGKISVVRKVLRELERSVLTRCKFVALPWLCEWE